MLSWFYRFASILNTITAISKGKGPQRLARIAVGRTAGRISRSIR